MHQEDTRGSEHDSTIGESSQSSSIDGPRDSMRRLVLAGIGAVAEACDTAEHAFDRFVGRGEAVQHDWREQAREVGARNADARQRAQGYFRQAMDAVLDGLSVPNKADVDTINVKLNILTRKLDDLQMHQVRGASSQSTPAAEVPEPPARPGETAT